MKSDLPFLLRNWKSKPYKSLDAHLFLNPIPSYFYNETSVVTVTLYLERTICAIFVVPCWCVVLFVGLIASGRYWSRAQGRRYTADTWWNTAATTTTTTIAHAMNTGKCVLSFKIYCMEFTASVLTSQHFSAHFTTLINDFLFTCGMQIINACQGCFLFKHCVNRLG